LNTTGCHLIFIILRTTPSVLQKSKAEENTLLPVVSLVVVDVDVVVLVVVELVAVEDVVCFVVVIAPSDSGAVDSFAPEVVFPTSVTVDAPDGAVVAGSIGRTS